MVVQLLQGTLAASAGPGSWTIDWRSSAYAGSHGSESDDEGKLRKEHQYDVWLGDDHDIEYWFGYMQVIFASFMLCAGYV